MNAKITITQQKNIQQREKEFKEKVWQDEVLKGNLFQMDEGKIDFQNRATKEYVEEYSKKINFNQLIQIF